MAEQQAWLDDGTPASAFVWECLAGAHSHAAAELNWPRFVAWVRGKAGWEVPEEQIRQALAETLDPDKDEEE